MAKIGFQASHEQFSPSELLHFVQLAEKAGFDFILSSDHNVRQKNYTICLLNLYSFI